MRTEGTEAICELCETAAATAIKIETEEEYDEDGYGFEVKIEVLVCTKCASEWYDGTEEYPGTYPLHMLALAA